MAEASEHGDASDLAVSTPLTVADPVVLVLAHGETPAAVRNARGHLFEVFVARLLHAYGYGAPTRERLNVSADGIELDVVASHDLSGQGAVAECKAYTSPVPASMLGTFHSKLVTRRFDALDTQGFFVAIPRLTSSGHEYARKITAHDRNFHVLTAATIADLLHARQVIVDCPLEGLLSSDPAVVVTEHGVHAACLELDASTRKPVRVVVWAAHGAVPTAVLEAVATAEYAQGCPAVDARGAVSAPRPPRTETPPLIVAVTGSGSDFEYHLPAAPKFFVGRQRLVAQLGRALDDNAGVLVLNAKSGWGKSSAALRLKALAAQRKGHALIVDSRTATHKRFVTDALSLAARQAQKARVLSLPGDASWASLGSALQTLSTATWHAGPLVVFFDQFENVFTDAELTREFRDLALAARELADHVLIGFAWKTDLVAWTEDHPYQLRDQIRANATVLKLGPLGASEISILLRRLEKAMDEPLARDLRTRLREYSQGLPWLFKKLAGHLLREVKEGVTQEELASEALNAQNLFDADLAELSPAEHEAIRHIARYAPLPIGEVMERVTGPIVTSLLDRRLVVQVGESLDIYWDIFRDYLTTGRIPVEDSYILRMGPSSVARLLQQVVADDGNSHVRDLAQRMNTSEKVVFNLSRELRLLGATAYEPNRVRLLPDIWHADDREDELRRRVASSLRRHRAFTTFFALSDRAGGATINAYARELPSAFPAVEVSETTWIAYARVYLQWFEYAGLALQRSTTWQPAPEASPGTGNLLGGPLRRRLRGGFPHDAPGPSLQLLLRIASGDTTVRETERRTAAPLLIIGAVTETNGGYRLRHDGLVADGAVVPGELRRLMLTVPGVREGLAVLETDPRARPHQVGQAVREALEASWVPSTADVVGKHLRSWARAAGVDVQPVHRTESVQPQEGLF
ncbi:restriction endonuclease [Streptomyces shenzhenensis]|uniref:restriction endonuclease n=1 Tax=Streptomyces shenzhenensis TaxID=943815 RepID=UPI00380E7CE4